MSVLDASVVLKWFVNEDDGEQALRLREEFYHGEREIAPDLLLYEVANALRYNPDFTVEEIVQALRTLFDMGIWIITPTYALLSKVVELAKSLDITCYDATYLALAEELEFEFITAITADKRLHTKAIKGAGSRIETKLLSDLTGN